MADGLPEIGRWLVGLGGLLVVVGLVLILAGRMPGIGRLPGDILYRKGPVTFYFPVTTCILLSLVLSLLAALFRR